MGAVDSPPLQDGDFAAADDAMVSASAMVSGPAALFFRELVGQVRITPTEDDAPAVLEIAGLAD